MTVRVAALETAVLAALETGLTAILADAFAAEFAQETVRLTRSLAVGDDVAVAPLAVVDTELANLSSNLMVGTVGPAIMKLRQSEKPIAPSKLPWRAVFERYALKISDWRASLSQPEVRTEAAQIIQDLLESVTILSDAPSGPQADIAASLGI